MNTSSKLLGLALAMIATGAIAGCMADAGELDRVDERGAMSPSTQELAVDESAGDLELAAAIAEGKLADLGDATLIPKHAGCGTPGATAMSTSNDDAPRNGAANQRSGSSIDCGAVGVLQPTDDALYFCFTWEAGGMFSWTYNQNLRTGVRGWTRDDLLDDNGSPIYCGF